LLALEYQLDSKRRRRKCDMFFHYSGVYSLRHFLFQFGPVVAVTRSTDKETGKRKRFAFVEFNDYDPVDKAIIKVNY